MYQERGPTNATRLRLIGGSREHCQVLVVRGCTRQSYGQGKGTMYETIYTTCVQISIATLKWVRGSAPYLPLI